MKAVRIQINGIVQGVGFRPYIYRLAKRHRLTGWVLNSSRGVEVLAQGLPEDADDFLAAIPKELPPQAVIDQLSHAEVAPEEHQSFTIRESLGNDGFTRISPDIALCDDCLAEMLDPGNRRHQYPFTNCTNCGPRFSIIRDTPYDRPLTTMSAFAMCPECQREYRDPEDRRFHAQPNACPVCGPRVWLADTEGREISEKGQAIADAARLLAEGRILAVKGIGGFHLACDAASDRAVKTLRSRKTRPHKPLAVMCPTLEAARMICRVSPQEAAALESSPAPIVLLKKKGHQQIRLSDLLAPGNSYLGVMLPYAPLHHLLYRELELVRPGANCLVMTSGNIQDRPVTASNREALDQLSGIADCFLLNDRDIENRCDDSIVFVEEERPRAALQIVRHARGFAPNPIRLPREVPPVLGVGGEMKNIFCLAAGKQAYVSQHIGEMGNQASLEYFAEMVDKYRRWFGLRPELVVHDLHPDYQTTRWAREQSGIALRPIQHHQAHILSTLADNGRWEPCIGVAFDGTGYGEDGRIWGGEFFLFDGQRVGRAGHLEYLPLPGGDAAIRKPYRIAAAYSKHLLGRVPDELLAGTSREELEVISRQLENGFNLAWTSSLGRLFDAASALLGVCPTITFEAQAAMALENCCRDGAVGHYECPITAREGLYVVQIRTLWEQLTADAIRGAAIDDCSARFHHAIVDFTAGMCDNLKIDSGVNLVALSGGVFQNRRLLGLVRQRLEREGFEVLAHRQVPSNDGGIALGQAMAANLED